MKPYEPPPDYPMPTLVRPAKDHQRSREVQHQIHHQPHHHLNQQSHYSALHRPIEGAHYDPRLYRHREPLREHYGPPPMMLRTRQFPEVAGIFGCEEQPALRRFTRYNEAAMLTREPPPPQQPQPATSYSKSSKKPSFFSGNWTFRDKKPSRPSLQREHNSAFRRDERPVSMIVPDARGLRSRSETSSRQLSVGERQTAIVTGGEYRVPVRLEQSQAEQKHRQDFTTHITVEDSATAAAAVLRPKRLSNEENNNNNNNNNNNVTSRSWQSSQQLRKSCPDLDSAVESEQLRASKKRNRRARQKAREARWREKHIQDWCLDDVLLWLQHLQLDDVASLLVGYDIRGEDLLQWNQQCLAQLGVSDAASRSKVLQELEELKARGPEEQKVESRTTRTLFDLVRQTCYDQVLAVETPLTTRDISVTLGRFGCLQVTKVNGSNLPLRQHDCLLEINERSGEQFKSALMLTKLITASGGEPIRFVVLRQKGTEPSEDSSSNDTSSSGVSSSPRSQID